MHAFPRQKSRRRLSSAPAILSASLLLASQPPMQAWGQRAGASAVQDEVFAGSALEEYLRMLQTIGSVQRYPWSVRSFSPAEVERFAPSGAHPWRGRYAFGRDSTLRSSIRMLRPAGRILYNSAVPYGYNDGAVWAGRGVTAAIRVGFSARHGAFSMVVAPEMIGVENRDFAIVDRAVSGDARFADPVYPTMIDLPQRIGEEPYTRLSPGESTLRAELGPLALAASTANQQWGPAWDQPLLLGSNAAGFPHLYLSTSRPLDAFVGDLHGRIVWGVLSQSRYAPEEILTERRFMSGLVMVLQPRGLNGLEIGGSRFFHDSWPQGGPGLDEFLWPLQAFLKERLPETNPDRNDADNQLASVFARWVLPRGGAEFYGEYAREDHSWNLRDLALEPDHNSAFLVGMSKAWQMSQERIVSLRAEHLDAQMTHLDQVRPQAPLYVHSQQRQGHTHLGQILGASSGYGGGHTRVAVDVYHPRGKWGGGVTRSQRRVPLTVESMTRGPGEEADVMYAAEVTGTFFLGRFDLDAAISPVYEFNRNLEGDVFNLNARLGVRARL